MKKLLSRRKRKKEPVNTFDGYFGVYDRGYPTSTATFNDMCGTTITNGTTYLSGSLTLTGSCSTSLVVSDGTTYTTLSSGVYGKTMEDYKKEVQSIPPKNVIHKFLNKYVGDEFRLSEKKDNKPDYFSPFALLNSEEQYQIVSNNDIMVLSFYRAYGQISYNIDKTLTDMVADFLQIPFDYVQSIIKQWFWEKNNFFSDSGLELSKFIP